MRNSNTANNVKCYEDVDPLWHFNGITYKKYSSTMWNGNSIKCCEDDLDKASWLNVG